MYSPRVSVPSRGGSYERILSSRDFASQGFTGDNGRTAAVLSVTWTALIADSPLNDLKPNWVYHRFVVHDLLTDLKGTIKSFASLAHQITKQFSKVDGVYIRADYIKAMEKTPVYREYLHFFKTGDPATLRFLLSFLTYGKKMPFADDALNATALRGWYEVEEKLRNLTIPPFVENLRNIMEVIFEEWEPDHFLPRHGGGAVAQRDIRGVGQKNSAFKLYDRLSNLYGRDQSDYELQNGWGSLWPHESVDDLTAMPSHNVSSRLKFVPKDWRKTRSICMEPVEYQWAQQGVRLWYERTLSDGILGEHVHLRDQTKNQDAATHGSLFQSVDTIDLSAASDSVAWELVKAVFPPKVLKHLGATRTSIVEVPGGKNVRVAKFAPMGSALCFPVQSTIFSAVVLMVGIAYRYGVDWNQPYVFENADTFKDLYAQTFGAYFTEEDVTGDYRLQPFYVYGDDIICDKRITSNVMDALVQLGFEVNREKSYTGPVLFRESCGIFSFNGYDVTPLIFKVKRATRRMSVTSLDSYIQLANRAKAYGYVQLRKHVIQYVLHTDLIGVRKRAESKNPILFTSDTDEAFAIHSDSPRNKHLKRRFYDPRKGPIPDMTSQLYQRDEILSLSIGPKDSRELSLEDDNYLLTVWWRSKYGEVKANERRDDFDANFSTNWWRSQYGGVDPDGFTVGIPKADTLRVGAAWRWTATSE